MQTFTGLEGKLKTLTDYEGAETPLLAPAPRSGSLTGACSGPSAAGWLWAGTGAWALGPPALRAAPARRPGARRATAARGGGSGPGGAARTADTALRGSRGGRRAWPAGERGTGEGRGPKAAAARRARKGTARLRQAAAAAASGRRARLTRCHPPPAIPEGDGKGPAAPLRAAPASRRPPVTHPRFGPLGTSHGRTPPTTPQKTLMTMMGTVRPPYAMAGLAGAAAEGSCSVRPGAAPPPPLPPCRPQRPSPPRPPIRARHVTGGAPDSAWPRPPGSALRRRRAGGSPTNRARRH